MSQVSNAQYTAEIYKMIRFGMSKEQIFYKLRIQHCPQNIEEKLLQVVMDQTCDDYPDYELIQTIVRSKLALDRDAERSKLHIVDYLTRQIFTMDQQRVMKLFDNKYDFRNKIFTCSFEYLPYFQKAMVKQEGLWKFNTYVPPFWQEEAFYTEGAVPVTKVTKLPPLYKKFITHLVDNDKASYEYVLDWMANALQNRNYCILTTIGLQGVGKGVLAGILRSLVGDHNFVVTDKKLVRKDFNGQIHGKRIVYVDEVKISNADEENKLKSLINDVIEIEKKGKDAILTDNYASIYISSNQLNSLRLTADDRRFSIVNLASKKLLDVMSESEIKALRDEENIEELAKYLYYRKVDSEKMMRVFKSDRTEEVRSNQLNPWQEWFIEEFCFEHAGKDVEMTAAATAIEEEFGGGARCGRAAFKKLSDIYPDKFIVKSPKRRIEMDGKIRRKTVWVLEIMPWKDME